MNRSVILMLMAIMFAGAIAPAYADLDFDVGELVENSLLSDTTGFQPIDNGGAVTNDLIECKLKHTTQVLFTDGSADIVQSSGIFGSPQLSFFNVAGTKEISQFNIIPKIFCSLAPNLPSTFNSIIVGGSSSATGEDSLLQLRVVAKGNGLAEAGKTTFVQTLEPVRVDFSVSGDNEKELATWFVPANQIYEDVPNTDGTVNLEFHQRGTIYLDYVGADFNSNMRFNIDHGDITSYYTVQNRAEQVDTDGDGIPDVQDDCDSQRETFNNFNDLDGCPDTAPSTVPPTGTPTPQEPPVDEQAVCESQGGIWEVVSYFDTSILGFRTLETCTFPPEPTTTPPTTPPTTSDPDSDADGIPDSIDQCDFARETFNGFEDSDGCPDIEPTQPTPPTQDDAQNLADLQAGSFIHKVTFNYADGTSDEVFPSNPDFIAGSVEIAGSDLTPFTPASFLGSPTGTGLKEVESITLEPFYVVPSGVDASDISVLAPSTLSYSPTAVLSSVQMADGSSETVRVNFEQPLTQLPNALFGASLGTATFQAIDLKNTAISAGITTGQTRDVDFAINVISNIKLQKGNTVADFTTQNGFVTILDFTVSNNVQPTAPVNCEAVGLVPDQIDPVTGNVLTCQDPSAGGNTDICLTQERPEGFSCDENFQNQNCSGSTATSSGAVFSCTEPDDDNDGIPNVNDSCVNLPEDGDPAGNPSDGCPFEGTPIETQTCPDGRQIAIQDSCDDEPETPCFGSLCFPDTPNPPPTNICLQSITEDCPDPQTGQTGGFDTNTLIIIGSVLAVGGIAGIILARRR